MSFQTTAHYEPGTLDAANEDTKMLFAKDFRNVVFTFIAANSADCTIKIYSSNQESRPDIDSAASATNEYSTVQVVDLEDGSFIAGDKGIVYTGSSDGIHKYEINNNGANWIGAIMTARAAGDVTVKVDLKDNS